MKPQHANDPIVQAEETGSSSLAGDQGSLADGKFPQRRRGVDFRAVRDAVTIAQVLELLEWAPVSRFGPQLRGPCPIHKSSNEHSRSFSVNVAANAFQCFSCGGKGNQLDLWSACTGLPLYEATLDLARRLQLEPPQLTKRKER